jgi:hypothetical protein
VKIAIWLSVFIFEMYSTYSVRPTNHNARVRLCFDVLCEFFIANDGLQVLRKVDIQIKMRVFTRACIKAFLLVLLEGDKHDAGRQRCRCNLTSRGNRNVCGCLVVGGNYCVNGIVLSCTSHTRVTNRDFRQIRGWQAYLH